MISEILKYILPALIVLATAYFILKKFLDAQHAKSVLEYRSKMVDQKLPLKLQAYERLMLFCERIDLKNMVLRLRNSNMRVSDLTTVMLVTIQKEYEHNLAQQLYVSDSLWKILQLSKDNMVSIVSDFSSKFNQEDLAEDFANLLIVASAADDNPLFAARQAIKEEIKLILQ